MKRILSLWLLVGLISAGCSKKVLDVDRESVVTPVSEISPQSSDLLMGLACELLAGESSTSSQSLELVLFVRESSQLAEDYEIHSITATNGIAVEEIQRSVQGSRVIVSAGVAGEVTATVSDGSQTASCKATLTQGGGSTGPMGLFLDGAKSANVLEGGQSWLLWLSPEGSRCQIRFPNGSFQEVSPVGQSIIGPLRSSGEAMLMISLQCDVPGLGLRTDSVNLVFGRAAPKLRVTYLGLPGPDTPIRIQWSGSGDCQVIASVGPISAPFASTNRGIRTLGPRELPRPTEVFPAFYRLQCGTDPSSKSEAFLPVGRRPELRLTANGVANEYVRPEAGEVEIQWESIGALSCELSNLNETSLRGKSTISVADMAGVQVYDFRCVNPWGETFQRLTIQPPACVESELTVLSGSPKSDGGMINERLSEKGYPVMPGTGSVKLDEDTAKNICGLFEMNTVLEMGCNSACSYSSASNNSLLVWRDNTFVNRNAQAEGNRKLGVLVCAKVCSEE